MTAGLSFADIDEVWASAKPSPRTSVCDLAKNSAYGRELLPKPFNDDINDNILLLPNGDKYDHKRLVNKTPSTLEATVKESQAINPLTLEPIESSQVGTTQLESFNDNPFTIGFDNKSLVNLLLYIVTGIFLIFILDQFTRLGAQIRGCRFPS